MELIRSFDWERMSPASASALFWYVRNRLLFDLDLTDRSRPRGGLVPGARAATPGRRSNRCSTCSDLRFTDDLIAHIDARESASSAGKPPLDIDPRVRRLCAELEDRLDAVARGSPASRRARQARYRRIGGRHDLTAPGPHDRAGDHPSTPAGPRPVVGGILAAIALIVTVASLIGADNVQAAVIVLGGRRRHRARLPGADPLRALRPRAACSCASSLDVVGGAGTTVTNPSSLISLTFMAASLLWLAARSYRGVRMRVDPDRAAHLLRRSPAS